MVKDSVKILFTLLAVLQLFFPVNFVYCNLLTIDHLPSYLIEDILTLPVSVQVTNPPTVILVKVYLESSIGLEQRIYQRKYILHRDGCITAIFDIPRKYLYYDSRNFDQATDYFAKSLRSHICIFDKRKGNCVMGEEVSITLPGPLDRSELPTYSHLWSFELIKLKQKRMVPLCVDIAGTSCSIITDILI